MAALFFVSLSLAEKREHDEPTSTPEPVGGSHGKDGLVRAHFAKHFDAHPDQITQWSVPPLEGAEQVMALEKFHGGL